MLYSSKNERRNQKQSTKKTQWRMRPHTIWTTGMTQYLSAEEYTCLLWSRSKHVEHLNMTLNKLAEL